MEPALDLDGARYPALWLRDNCPCRRCADPRSGQKLLSITDLPAEVAIAAVEAGDERIEVLFAPDGHQSVFTRAWLAAHRPGRGPAPDARAEDAKLLWQGADQSDPPQGSWPRFQQDDAHREWCLEALLRKGFVLLQRVPTADRAVLEVAAGFGYVRRTNYGTLFEVRVQQEAANLAFTSLPIRPHTDNPYRDPVPTIQLLHCLRNAAGGGDSGLVDGFHAAALLRSTAPEQFELLARIPVVFRYADAEADLTATRPLIGLDPVGRIREVRFNNRSMQPLGLPADEADAYYRAYRRFAELLYRPEAQFALRLEPGDCLVFDNTRVLHSRTGFTAGGERHLQGCYADLDGAASNLAVLRRGRAAHRPAVG
ncbi:MAG: 2-trimethylaminoethylphosphonate dioxygenase [Trebonia sp.]